MLGEIVVVIGVITILVLAITSLSMYSGRSFAAIFNYVDLDEANRLVMDQLSRDLRQASRVTACTSNSLILEDADLSTLSYTYHRGSRTLSRAKGNSARVLLHDCDNLRFDVVRRSQLDGVRDVYPTAAGTAKVIDVSWVCSRTIFGRNQNPESIPIARVVLGKPRI